jgi:4-alpha-glucanotransferase
MTTTKAPARAGFPDGYRAAGVLLHFTSFPSPYGIGDLGPSAHEWIDLLAAAGQTWWQFLPFGQTVLNDSPYSPLSSFGGNPLLISPDKLLEDRLLTPADIAGASFPAEYVDYNAVREFKSRLLEVAYDRFQSGERGDLREPLARFVSRHQDWLEDFALFVALKERYHGAAYLDWPRELVHREPAALTRARGELADAIDRIHFQQYLFFRQAAQIVEHAHRVGVKLVDDLPIFVSADSVDVWSRPELFLLDDNRRPTFVAGVPPDYFSPTGQLWGNPHYDWDAHRRTNYAWWTQRIASRTSYVDLLRIDHFRGFAAAWHVEADEPTAVHGAWVPGPGAEFFSHLERELGGLPLLAEDLGLITKDVLQLRDQFHLPGMLVLQFAFDGDPKNLFLPEHFVHNAVAYTGTHDNDTTRGWYAELPDAGRQALWKHLRRPPGEEHEVAWELIRMAHQSRAAVVIVPLQDLLNLGTEARMNVPGMPEGNWRWRYTPQMPVREAFERLRELTEASGRGAGGRS